MARSFFHCIFLLGKNVFRTYFNLDELITLLFFPELLIPGIHRLKGNLEMISRKGFHAIVSECVCGFQDILVSYSVFSYISDQMQELLPVFLEETMEDDLHAHRHLMKGLGVLYSGGFL